MEYIKISKRLIPNNMYWRTEVFNYRKLNNKIEYFSEANKVWCSSGLSDEAILNISIPIYAYFKHKYFLFKII